MLPMTKPDNSNPRDRPGEFELIAAYFAPLAGEGSFGLLDDAALVRVTPGKALAMTQDATAAGVHFLREDDPASIARKALRVNLSDLAAKGAVPSAFSLALGLHDDWDEAWVAGFAKGLAADCEEFGLSLSGGDTFRAKDGPVISITAWGEMVPADYASRLGASPGDRLYVTGTIGDAALGLKVRLGEPDYCALGGAGDLLERYLVPAPPVAFAPLVAQFASAAMDISDGFVGDLQKLAKASGVDFEIALDAVPFSRSTREALALPGALEAALTGGDDYQILLTVPEAGVAAFEASAGQGRVRVSFLGVATKGSGRVSVLAPNGEALQLGRTSFTHFEPPQSPA